MDISLSADNTERRSVIDPATVAGFAHPTSRKPPVVEEEEKKAYSSENPHPIKLVCQPVPVAWPPSSPPPSPSATAVSFLLM